jgi:DUSAM domain-containing protein
MGDLEDDWEPIRRLDNGVQQGAPLELTEDVRAILRRTGPTVAISGSEVDAALTTQEGATALLREMRRRITEGSHRIMGALDRMYRLQEKGDLDGARQQLHDVLAVEEVPHYREMAEAALARHARLEAVATSGKVDADLPPWSQVQVLARRVQQGKPLELREDMRDFLRRVAASVALGEAEAEAALQSEQGAQELLGKVLKRIRDGERRFLKAMYRMTSLRDAGDLEGARQQLRDVLAVEVIPMYRKMAEEHLAGLDEPLPKP